MQFDLASSSKLFLITLTIVLSRGCCQEGWFCFCYYDVDTGQVFVFCVNWCLLGHIYKIGSVLCCWVSLFICLYIKLLSVVHLLLLFMQCTCLDLIATMAVVYRVGAQ